MIASLGLGHYERDKSHSYSVLCTLYEKGLEGSPYQRGISESIASTYSNFFLKLKNTNIDWRGFKTHEARYFEEILEFATHVTLNTREGEIIVGDELEYLKSIFKDIDKLVEYVTSHKTYNKEFSDMLLCLREIACKNMIHIPNGKVTLENPINTFGKIFETYEYLYKVLHRVYKDWANLTSRGFSLQTFYCFHDSFEYNLHRTDFRQTADDKFNGFMGLLDGKNKLVPQYEFKAVSYQPVPIDFQGQLVRTVSSQYDNKPKTVAPIETAE